MDSSPEGKRTSSAQATPTLPAFADEQGFLRVWCQPCNRWHYHGMGAGHRVAHCIDKRSPYRDTGYTLHPVGTWQGERKTPRYPSMEEYHIHEGAV
jgi:hypothetical protein